MARGSGILMIYVRFTIMKIIMNLTLRYLWVYMETVMKIFNTYYGNARKLFDYSANL